MPWEDLCPWALSGPSFHLFVLKHKVGQIPWRVRELCGQYAECVSVLLGTYQYSGSKPHNLAPACTSSPALCTYTHTLTCTHRYRYKYIWAYIDTHTHIDKYTCVDIYTET